MKYTQNMCSCWPLATLIRKWATLIRKWVFLFYSSSSVFTKIKIRGHPFSVYAKFSEKLTFPTPWYAHVPVSFSNNFAYVLNGWTIMNVPWQNVNNFLSVVLKKFAVRKEKIWNWKQEAGKPFSPEATVCTCFSTKCS